MVRFMLLEILIFVYDRYKEDVLNHKKKDADKEKLGRNVWVLCLRSEWFPVLVWIVDVVFFCDLQAAGFVGVVLQLQHSIGAAVSGDCGYQLHQFLDTE